MQKKLLLVTAIVSLFILSSCQKDPSQDLTPGPTNNRVKTYTESITSSGGNYSTTYDISYDNSGRVISLISTSSPGDKFIFSYPSTSTYKMDIFDSGILAIHEDFYLNASFLADSTFQYNDTYDTLTEGYTYNANKQLITLKQYDYYKSTGSVLFNTTTYTYGTDGNLLKTQDSYGETHTYEYYSNYSYVPPITIGPITVASTKKVNLIKKHTITSNGSVTETADITYTFDDKNRISTERYVYNDGSIATNTYTYF